MIERKSIRLSEENYVGRRWYFVTACCERRRKLFSKSANANWIIASLRSVASTFGFRIHAYCVMPDHLHLLAEGCQDSSNLLAFIGRLKQKTSHEWSGHSASPFWQKKFYDHILRRTQSIDAVARYIWMNPVRRGLCKAPHEYPFSGSFTEDWRKNEESSDVWCPPWKKKMPG